MLKKPIISADSTQSAGLIKKTTFTKWHFVKY